MLAQGECLLGIYRKTGFKKHSGKDALSLRESSAKCAVIDGTAAAGSRASLENRSGASILFGQTQRFACAMPEGFGDISPFSCNDASVGNFGRNAGCRQPPHLFGTDRYGLTVFHKLKNREKWRTATVIAARNTGKTGADNIAVRRC